MLNIKKIIKVNLVLLASILLVITFAAKFNTSDSMIASTNSTNLSLVAETDKTKEEVRSELLAEIENFQYVNKDFYTNDSYNNYINTLYKAINIYNSINSSLDEITNISSALQLSYENLTLIYGKDNLKALLDYVKTIDLNKYTPASVDKLALVYNEALSVYNDSFALDNDIKRVMLSINKCINNLTLQADFSKLEQLMVKWETQDKKVFSVSSIEYVNSIYNKIKIIFDDKNSTQAVIDLAYAEFNTALNKLSLIGDREIINSLIDKINNLEKVIYKPADIKIIENEIKNVEASIKNDDSKENIQYLYEHLNKIYNELEIDENRNILFNAIKEGNEKDLSNVKPKTRTQYTSLLMEAKKLLDKDDASNDEVLEFIDRINNFSFKNKIKRDVLWWPNIIVWVIAAIIIIGITIAWCCDDIGAGIGYCVCACILYIPSFVCFAIFGMPYYAWWANLLINLGIGIGGFIISVVVGFIVEDI